MTLVALLYVSRSLIPPPQADAVVQSIVATASERNPALGVTGALIFAGGMFAQWLEGEALSVEALTARIRQDPRHAEVTVIVESLADARRFGRWSMAYAGPSLVAARAVTRPLFEMERGSAPQIDAILKLMHDFAPDDPPAPVDGR